MGAEDGAILSKLLPKILCPNCGEANLEQHRRKPNLLVCPLCWHKYEKEPALRGEFKRVKTKKKARYGDSLRYAERRRLV